jgi:hypothetical protein
MNKYKNIEATEHKPTAKFMSTKVIKDYKTDFVLSTPDSK